MACPPFKCPWFGMAENQAGARQIDSAPGVGPATGVRVIDSNRRPRRDRGRRSRHRHMPYCVGVNCMEPPEIVPSMLFVPNVFTAWFTVMEIAVMFSTKVEPPTREVAWLLIKPVPLLWLTTVLMTLAVVPAPVPAAPSILMPFTQKVMEEPSNVMCPFVRTRAPSEAIFAMVEEVTAAETNGPPEFNRSMPRLVL